MYVCGPTVYDMSHIGHARSAVAFDVIYRYLKYKGFNVKYVRNYTDVDDKIINRAREEGLSSKAVAERYIKHFDDDMSALGITLPDYRPKATETIKEIVELIKILIDKGHAYVIEYEDHKGACNSDVYFRVRSFNDYGKLSGKNIEELEAGARVDVDIRKEDPLDFALWKASRSGEPSWKSPWGNGRPGWHIECSAMSKKFLGDTIDIHGGGKDLIFPHHENEVAQSEAATGKPFVRYWLHNGFVNIEQEKMSKSLGNIILIRDALRIFHPEVIRLLFLSSHYRNPIDYSEKNLKDMESGLNRAYLTLERIDKFIAAAKQVDKGIDEGSLNGIEQEVHSKSSGILGDFIRAMDDDFNTAKTIGYVFDLLRSVNRFLDDRTALKSNTAPRVLAGIRTNLEDIKEVLGIFITPPAEYLKDRKKRFLASSGLKLSYIQGLMEERAEARRLKDFKRADGIRETLYRKGVILEDTTEGTVWTVKD